MKRTVKLIAILCFALQGAGFFFAKAQNSFENLDFESASLAFIPQNQLGGIVSFNAAVPDWTGYLGTTQTSQAYQDNVAADQASIDIFGPDWLNIIGGHYSLLLQSGFDPNNTSQLVPVNASISQNGLVPGNDRSLLFRAWGDTGNLEVSFSGNSLSPVLLATGQGSSGQSYNLYGVNIAPFAGQTGQLEFTETFNPNPPFTQVLLDDIAFSPTAVPEPSTVALLILGGLAMVTHRRRAKGL